MKKVFNVFYIGLALIFVGCNNNNEPMTISNIEENPTAEEVLKEDSEADILMYYGTIYNTNVDWVGELTLTKGEQVGEIKEQAMEGTMIIQTVWQINYQ